MTYQQDNQGGQGGFGGGYNRGGFAPRAPRPMVDVTAMNIVCADCGAPVTQLPFQPDPARLNTIRCRDCVRKNRPPRY